MHCRGAIISIATNKDDPMLKVALEFSNRRSP